MFAPSAHLTSDLLGKCRKALHPSRLSRPLALRVNQLSKIHRTHQPWRLLAAEPEGATRQHLRWRPSPRFCITEAEIFGRYLFQRDICLAEFGQEAKVSAVNCH